jgi:RimJ/RimL family protein N-acetyltransferase
MSGLYPAREGRNKYTGKDEEPDERLMRSIEEKIDIPDARKDDFRQEIMNYIGALALDGKKFEYHTNARLHRALELKLFEDQRDTIKLKNVVSGVVDDETQAKIDVVKQRLIKFFGYNETSATDVLNYVASIFARGDAKGCSERDVIEVGWRFFKAFWGRGYATATGRALVELGFREHDLPRVIAMAMVENLASCRAIQKCGLNPYGDYEILGRTARMFVITRAEWQAKL